MRSKCRQRYQQSDHLNHGLAHAVHLVSWGGFQRELQCGVIGRAEEELEMVRERRRRTSIALTSKQQCAQQLYRYISGLSAGRDAGTKTGTGHSRRSYAHDIVHAFAFRVSSLLLVELLQLTLAFLVSHLDRHRCDAVQVKCLHSHSHNHCYRDTNIKQM